MRPVRHVRSRSPAKNLSGAQFQMSLTRVSSAAAGCRARRHRSRSNHPVSRHQAATRAIMFSSEATRALRGRAREVAKSFSTCNRPQFNSGIRMMDATKMRTSFYGTKRARKDRILATCKYRTKKQNPTKANHS